MGFRCCHLFDHSFSGQVCHDAKKIAALGNLPGYSGVCPRLRSFVSTKVQPTHVASRLIFALRINFTSSNQSAFFAGFFTGLLKLGYMPTLHEARFWIRQVSVHKNKPAPSIGEAGL
jgi:hypothetical protein